MSTEDEDDLSEFHGVFFDEVDEHLAAMETLLLEIALDAPDAEQVNAIFRAAHSIKGGSAVFGFDDSTALTHEMETVFDRVRKGAMPLSKDVVDAFLTAGDLLKAMFANRRGQSDAVEPAEVERLCAHLRALMGGIAADAHAETDARPVNTGVADAAVPPTGVPEVQAVATGEPSTAASDGEIEQRMQPAATVTALKPVAKPPAGNADDTSSIRVGIQKVDQLINLVGELVITQSMLAQTASTADAALSDRLANGLSQLQRNTRDLQEAAMSMRMMPMSSAFSRFPRLVRDTAAKLGKDVELHTAGEGTELDKGLIERIVDPLTHLVRNSLDHGIETPDERVANGKPPTGHVTLRARHQGGAIVIEVSDDGRGLARDRIVAKARERGMHVSDATSDADVWQLIFEAGFSTAEVVTDVSGRGVGMDVVKRNIQSLGGRVEIDSTPGRGTRITIRLPLTLAILDGLSVGVGDEQFIIPLTNIVESLQPSASDLKTVGGRDRVVHVRGEYLPVVALHEVFDIHPCISAVENGILVILDADGRKTALLVDALIGQHQVVIKSLESNYRRVPGISGATIMGDGRVALILDANALADMSRPLLAA